MVWLPAGVAAPRQRVARRTLAVLDSGRTLVVLVLLVLASLSLLVCEFVLGQGALGSTWEAVGVSITVLFIVEVRGPRLLSLTLPYCSAFEEEDKS